MSEPEPTSPQNQVSEEEYLQCLGALFYGEPLKYWHALSPEQRSALLSWSCSDHQGAFFLYELQSELTESQQKPLQMMLREQQCEAMLRECVIAEVENALAEAEVRYVWLKGADLAFRVYPTPALRKYGDLDVMFHPEDCEKALGALQKHGWFSELEYSKGWCQHFAPLQKNGIVLEPHWTLPGFGNIDPRCFWEHLHPAASGSGKHLFSPEMNVLMLTRHASEEFFQLLHLSKYLLDVSFLNEKTPVDWQGVSTLARVMKQPDPCEFLGIFDAFFPKPLLEQMKPDPQRVEIYRKIWRLHGQFSDVQRQDWVLTDNQAWQWSWWRPRLMFYMPKNVRKKYHLPPSGAFFRLVAAYGEDVGAKLGWCIRHVFSSNSQLKEYLALIAKIEGQNRR